MEELLNLIKSLVPDVRVELFKENIHILVGYYPDGTNISQKLSNPVINSLKEHYSVLGFYAYPVPEIRTDPSTGEKMQMTKLWLRES